MSAVLTGLGRLCHDVADVVPGAGAEDAPEALRALLSRFAQAVPLLRLLAVADQVNDRLRR